MLECCDILCFLVRASDLTFDVALLVESFELVAVAVLVAEETAFRTALEVEESVAGVVGDDGVSSVL